MPPRFSSRCACWQDRYFENNLHEIGCRGVLTHNQKRFPQIALLHKESVATFGHSTVNVPVADLLKLLQLSLRELISSLGACPTLTVLLRRIIRNHLRRSRPEKILNVFQ